MSNNIKLKFPRKKKHYKKIMNLINNQVKPVNKIQIFLRGREITQVEY